MRIMVSGAGGFLGARLTRWLELQGHHVFGTSRSNPDGRMIALDDALAPECYAEIIKSGSIDAVVNVLAAGVNPADRDPERLIAANTMFPARLALAAKTAGAGLFIQIGSSAEYAPINKGTGIAETHPLVADRMYGASKAAGTLLLGATARQADLNAVVLRLFNIFGPGEKPFRLFPSLVARLSRGEPVLLSAGTQVRDFLFVDDACAAIERTLVHMARNGPGPEGIYNLAGGREETVRDFALATAHALNADPSLLQFGALPLRTDDLAYVVADTRRLDALIGPSRITELNDAIAATLAQRDDVSEHGHR